MPKVRTPAVAVKISHNILRLDPHTLNRPHSGMPDPDEHLVAGPARRHAGHPFFAVVPAQPDGDLDPFAGTSYLPRRGRPAFVKQLARSGRSAGVLRDPLRRR